MKQNFHVSIRGVIHHRGRFLLVIEPDGKAEAPGGRIEEGEDIIPVLYREIREEVNIDLESLDHSKQLVAVDNRNDYHGAENTNLLVVFYRIDLNDDMELDIKLSREHIDFVWIDKDFDLDVLVFKNENQKRIFAKLQGCLI